MLMRMDNYHMCQLYQSKRLERAKAEKSENTQAKKSREEEEDMTQRREKGGRGVSPQQRREGKDILNKAGLDWTQGGKTEDARDEKGGDPGMEGEKVGLSSKKN